MGRDRRFQAILPIRGKILNVEKARLQKIFQNQEVGTIIAALGCGFADTLNLEKLRYHRIIIMTDADVDGSHIRTLLLTFFYRHMPALIENNYIYIAQPPLYKVTRKKHSRYITSEKEMDSYLLQLGRQDVQIIDAKADKILDEKETNALVNLILDVEHFITAIERKAVPFREFLEAKNEKGEYPRYLISAFKNEPQKLVYSEDEFLEIAKNYDLEQRKNHEETLKDLTEEEIKEAMRHFRPKALPYIELYKEETFQNLHNRLQEAALTLDRYLIADGKLFFVKEDEDVSHDFFTMKELIDYLRLHGRKGVEIQRYKGLGEMNADQLWETTMNPEKRTLIQVTLPDAIAADHMFTMLMGEDVPPRRAFIESHALSVKNLDI
jgi:DNA gyrase subunit B